MPAQRFAQESTSHDDGVARIGTTHSNLTAPVLIEQALARGEGRLTDRGALVVATGEHTGRSPQDRYLVAHPSYQGNIWWGPINRPLEPAYFEHLLDEVHAYLQGREVFVCDAWACADPRHRLRVRVVAEHAWHALMSQCLLLPLDKAEENDAEPALTILVAAGMKAKPERAGTRTGTFIVLDFERGLVLIGGTHYAGEIKKAVFSFLNYLLPACGVFPMHCSANIGQAGDTALFFGLSGTGKTTLSADPERRLIGDDEHGWSDEGVFNIEGGCYAKTINLSHTEEPQIWHALRFGSVLENVVIDPQTRHPDFKDESVTENTRAAYPIDFIHNAATSGRGQHPANLIFLTCDAFGVLPPLSRLSTEQAMYHFLSGYTAKVAGTETGVTEPQATFSTCFAAPFLPLHPMRYAELLQDRLQRHGSQVWLINTGWTGGPYGRGNRIPLPHTRAMIRAILNGDLHHTSWSLDPIFGMPVPDQCLGVPANLLHARGTWPDAAEYDRYAQQLAKLFENNFKNYADRVPEEVRRAGPRASA